MVHSLNGRLPPARVESGQNVNASVNVSQVGTSTPTPTPAITDAMLPAANASAPRGATVPFQGDAKEQWHPAMTQARDYAKALGFADLKYEGTGVLARGFGPKPVNSFELQSIILVDAQGKNHELGSVLPEAHHLTALKSTAALVGEFRGLIDAHVEQTMPRAVPGSGNAAAEFLPGVTMGDEYAKKAGFAGVTREANEAMLSFGLSFDAAPKVSANQGQNIFLNHLDGSRELLGTLMPEDAHLSTIKSRWEVGRTIIGMVDEAIARREAAARPAEAPVVPTGLPMPAASELYVADPTTLGREWQRAADKASEYAQGLGFVGVRFEASGAMYFSIQAEPEVNPFEMQNLVLLNKDGTTTDLGMIDPQNGTGKYKSAAYLASEMSALIAKANVASGE